MNAMPINQISKHFLVTGANGFVGRALCGVLVQHGHFVKGAVRCSVVTKNSKTSQVVVGEINSQTDWTVALTGIEVVIHLAARVHVMQETSTDPLRDFRCTNVLGTEQLARVAAANGVKRFVYVSSIKVNGEETIGDHRYSEIDAASPQDPYGVSKWEAEQALHRVALETGMEIVIVRPPLVYGAGVKGNFALMLKVLIKSIPLPLASVSNLRSLVYIGNFVDALLQCATHPVAAGQT
jgi:nucleoside-diphosphate-sugar epimerase